MADNEEVIELVFDGAVIEFWNPFHSKKDGKFTTKSGASGSTLGPGGVIGGRGMDTPGPNGNAPGKYGKAPSVAETKAHEALQKEMRSKLNKHEAVPGASFGMSAPNAAKAQAEVESALKGHDKEIKPGKIGDAQRNIYLDLDGKSSITDRFLGDQPDSFHALNTGRMPTRAEAAALMSYTSFGHRLINGLMRDRFLADHVWDTMTRPAEAQRDRNYAAYFGNKIHGYLDTQSTPKPLTVHRYGDLPKGIKVGDVVADKGFMSTSMNPKQIRKFNDGISGKDVDSHSMEIRLPAGTKAVQIGHPTVGEGEVLVQAGAKMRVVSLNPTVLEHLP